MNPTTTPPPGQVSVYYDPLNKPHDLCDFNNIPAELRDLAQWVCWKLEMVKGRLTKVPYTADPERKADSTDPLTWGTFESCRDALQTGKFFGIGFVFADGGNLTGIDFDKHRDPTTGELDAFAAGFVQRLNSYTEASQSGTGCHVIARATIPGDKGRRDAKTGVEMYSKARFFVMTGDHITGAPQTVEARQSELEQTYNEVFAPKPKTPAPTKTYTLTAPSSSALTNDEIINKASQAKNGARFASLWRGDYAGAGYPSQSEADCALLSDLHFWTGGDKGRSFSMFAQSGLNRDKWEKREDYRESTWLRVAGGDTYDPQSRFTSTASSSSEPTETAKPRLKLTLRSPGEIIAMQFDDSDIVIGDRILAKGQPVVIAGQGGLGKSRWYIQAVACVVTGRKFLAFDTAGSDGRWLILQTENSNRRLRDDLDRLKQWLGEDDWQRFNDQVTFHTIENDDDGFVSLDSQENQAAIHAAIDESKPDHIVIDPLNDFGVGDLSKDSDMKATLTALSRVCRKGNPERTISVLHHALTGKGGAVKATGYDRSSFARNSKVLFAWTRAQINLAPVDPDSNDRLIVACGKCNNGKEFLPFGVRLNPETFIYECDPSVDVDQWVKDVAGQSNSGPLITNERVAELCRPATSKPDLAKVIMSDCGCARGSAYRYITRATGRTIKHNKANDTYSKK